MFVRMEPPDFACLEKVDMEYYRELGFCAAVTGLTAEEFRERFASVISHERGA